MGFLLLHQLEFELKNKQTNKHKYILWPNVGPFKNPEDDDAQRRHCEQSLDAASNLYFFLYFKQKKKNSNRMLTMKCFFSSLRSLYPHSQNASNIIPSLLALEHWPTSCVTSPTIRSPPSGWEEKRQSERHRERRCSRCLGWVEGDRGGGGHPICSVRWRDLCTLKDFLQYCVSSEGPSCYLWVWQRRGCRYSLSVRVQPHSSCTQRNTILWPDKQLWIELPP